MREEIRFEIDDFRNFDSLVMLTSTLDDLESYIVVQVSSTSIHSTIGYLSPLGLIVDVWTDGRTDGRTDFETGVIRSSLLRCRDDLKI